MMVRTKVLIVFLCSILIAGSPFGSLAADKIPTPPSRLGITSGTVSPTPTPAPVPPPPVTPPGNDGLLSGMTPGNYKIPSGWSMLRTQDFEGTCPSGEHCGVWGATPTTNLPHTGSKSLQGLYSTDQAAPAWLLDEGYVGTFSEIYVSFYEYIESQALFNDEFWIARFWRNTPVFQEIILVWLWSFDPNNQGQPMFNSPASNFFAVSQGTYGNEPPSREGRFAHKAATVPKGAWVQWEIHYRPNTPGNSDGFYRIYKDGNLYTSTENQNLNGSISMNNMAMQLGGTYTKLVWMKDYPTCTSCGAFAGDGTDYCTSSMGWWGQSFSNPKCAPIDKPLPSFKRYHDDIILMKK